MVMPPGREGVGVQTKYLTSLPTCGREAAETPPQLRCAGDRSSRAAGRTRWDPGWLSHVSPSSPAATHSTCAPWPSGMQRQRVKARCWGPQVPGSRRRRRASGHAQWAEAAAMARGGGEGWGGESLFICSWATAAAEHRAPGRGQ